MARAKPGKARETRPESESGRVEPTTANSDGTQEAGKPRRKRGAVPIGDDGVFRRRVVERNSLGVAEPTVTANGKPVGRPRKEVDTEQIVRLAEIGCSVEDIAHVVGVSQATLSHPRFLKVLEKGRSSGRSVLRRKQWEAAMNGNVVAQIWLGKQLLGQRDRWPDEKPQQEEPYRASAPDPAKSPVEPGKADAAPSAASEPEPSSDAS